jgi:transposase
MIIVGKGEDPPWIVADSLGSGSSRSGRRWSGVGGILFVLHTGVRWEFRPKERGVGSGMTCWRRLAEWPEAGGWERLHQLLLAELHAAEKLDWSRAVIDSSNVRSFKDDPKTGPGPAVRGRPASKPRWQRY